MVTIESSFSSPKYHCWIIFLPVRLPISASIMVHNQVVDLKRMYCYDYEINFFFFWWERWFLERDWSQTVALVLSFDCHQQLSIQITLVNWTWISIDFPANGKFTCHGRELIRTSKDDGFRYGEPIGPLGQWTNLANNQTDRMSGADDDAFGDQTGRWDAVEVQCHWFPFNKPQFRQVIPLIQHYRRKSRNQPNQLYR